MPLSDDPVVVAGEIVLSAWHNSQRNHAVRVAADVAALEGIDGLTDGMLGYASTTGQLYHRRGGVWVPVPTAIKVTALPATIPIPAAVNTVTIQGRLQVGGTGVTIPDSLAARFNGVTTGTYQRVLEQVGDSVAFARSFSNTATSALLGPVPFAGGGGNACIITSTVDANTCNWQSNGYASRSTTAWLKQNITGGFAAWVRLTSLELFVPSPTGIPAQIQIGVTFT